MRQPSSLGLLALGLVILCHGGLASAAAEPLATPLASSSKTPAGRPKVHLDRLDFPTQIAGAAELRRHLESVLAREVRRVEWGAGRDNRIEYRFSVTTLTVSSEGGVLHVACAATGALPGGRTAKSQLGFGGAPHERQRMLRQVLEIVARGVVTRLAELERRRRGLN